MTSMSVDIYKGVTKLGSGTANSSSASITSFTAVVSGTRLLSRNVSVHVPSDATHKGRTFQSRVIADNGSGTLTLADSHPFL